MDNAVLRKKLNTFKNSEGRLVNVADDVILSVLRAWENWPGTTADLYRELDLTKMQMVSMIKKAKVLVKSGVIGESEFHEVSQPSESPISSSSCNYAAEIVWQNDKTIRFNAVEQLIDFLKKVA